MCYEWAKTNETILQNDTSTLQCENGYRQEGSVPTASCNDNNGIYNISGCSENYCKLTSIPITEGPGDYTLYKFKHPLSHLQELANLQDPQENKLTLKQVFNHRDRDMIDGVRCLAKALYEPVNQAPPELYQKSGDTTLSKRLF